MRNKRKFLNKIGRAFKLNYMKLLRSKDGAKKVALGFAIGFGLEMLVISTAGLIYIFFVPAVRLSKGSLPASIIGNVIGKSTFLPVILLPFAKKIGKLIFPMKAGTTHHSPFSLQKLMNGDFQSLLSLFHGGLHVLIGMTVFGIVLGVISYYLVHYLYERGKKRRLQKVRKGKMIRDRSIEKFV